MYIRTFWRDLREVCERRGVGKAACYLIATFLVIYVVGYLIFWMLVVVDTVLSGAVDVVGLRPLMKYLSLFAYEIRAIAILVTVLLLVLWRRPKRENS